jgi:hypothetical protein
MSSGTFRATPSDDHGGQVPGPGRRWAFVAAAVAALAAAAVVVFLIAGGSGGKSVENTYGHLPKWLPKISTPAAPQLEVATVSKPILSEEQGYTVHAELPTGSVNITAAGPGFPAYVTNYAARGLWPASKPVPSVFYVTLADVKGTIPLAAGGFSVENQAYQQVGATVSLKGGGKAPASVHTGQTVTLAVHSTTLEGQGAIAWSPLGKKALIAWIYQVELD